jgi:hypothetical protein
MRLSSRLAAITAATGFALMLATAAPSGGQTQSPGSAQHEAATARRLHAWQLWSQLTATMPATSLPRFESWYGESAVFGTVDASAQQSGIEGFARGRLARHGGSMASPAATGGVPVLTYTLYDPLAYEHIRRHHLYRQAELRRLRQVGAVDSSVASDRSVPPFPQQAMVLKTAWWPVAAGGITPLPVWDPERNPPRRAGNSYLSWQRVVAVDPAWRSAEPATADVEFAGHAFVAAHRLGLQSLYYVQLDARTAARMMADPESQRAAWIALGRQLRAGDFLVLVAANLAARQGDDWLWVTYWWHDQPDAGPFAAQRPDSVHGAWRNYLMQLAYDGGPDICFDPWLEGRFPDGGSGGGSSSNCLTCHRRASYPAVAFLPVTRGAPDLPHDAAFASGRLRTNDIWSLALHASP